MRAAAARLSEHGRPLEVVDVELREPGDGEVVVDMAYGGVNPIDRYGALGRVAPDAPVPRTLGSEGSGTVEGRRVMVRGHRLGTGLDGLWSTRAVVPADSLIDLPDGVALDVAAGVGVAGVTAWRAVTQLAAVGPEDRVLVLGASGGVGSIAVSCAAHLGATVWGQTGDEAKAAWVRGRRAQRAVVVADAGDLPAAVADLHPTVVVDPLGGGFTGAAIEALAVRGRLVLLGTSAGMTGAVPLQQLYRKGITVLGYGGLIETDEVMRRHTGDALAALAGGRMEVVIDRVLPLDRVNDAFDLLEHRAVQGKLLLDLQG